MNKEKGFTLIELLVVIAIIGILSSIVLASLNSAREKGQDASASASISSLRAEAELYFDDAPNTYVGMCAIAEASGGLLGHMSVSYEEAKLMELEMIKDPETYD